MKQNKIMSMNPLTKVYMVLFFALSSLFYGWKYMCVCLGVMLLISILAGKGGSYFKTWIKTIVLISAFVFIMQALFLPGETVLWQFLFLRIKQEGIQNAIPICTRILGVGTSIVLAAQIIDINDLVIALEKKGVSPSISYIILSTINIIPQMSKKMNIIMDAQRSRGIETESNIIVRAKAFFPTIGPLILNSVVGAEERAITLEARAFSSKVRKTRLSVVNDTSIDKIWRGLFVLLLIAAVAGRIYLWIA